MERVTYPSEEVQKALKGRYQRIVLDVQEDAEFTAGLNVNALPTAIVFNTDGTEQRRHTGHAEPIDHAEWLK